MTKKTKTWWERKREESIKKFPYLWVETLVCNGHGNKVEDLDAPIKLWIRQAIKDALEEVRVKEKEKPTKVSFIKGKDGKMEKITEMMCENREEVGYNQAKQEVDENIEKLGL